MDVREEGGAQTGKDAPDVPRVFSASHGVTVPEAVSGTASSPSVCVGLCCVFDPSSPMNMKSATALLLAMIAPLVLAVEGQMNTPVVQEWSNGEKPPLSAAMNATLTMVIIFFVVEVGNYVFTVKGEYERVKGVVLGQRDTDGPDADRSVGDTMEDEFEKRMKQIQAMINLAEGVTTQIPMICLLVLFARLRAKVDLEGTEPQPFVKNTFMTVSLLVVLQACALALSGCGEKCSTINIVVQGVCKLGVFVCICIIIGSIVHLTKYVKM